VRLKTFADDDGMLDPAFLRARREMLVVLVLFGLALGWTIGFCYWLGYDATDGEPSEALSLVLGLPTWVFVGIVLPWLIIDLVAIWFCFYFLADDVVDDEPFERRDGRDALGRVAGAPREAGGPTNGRAL
jgi:hypothetical protein